MSRERTLDEALDEIDKWSAKVVAEIEGLSPEQVAKHFQEHSKTVRPNPTSKRQQKRKAAARK